MSSQVKEMIDVISSDTDNNIEPSGVILPKESDYEINTDYEESSSDQQDSKSFASSFGSSSFGLSGLENVSGTNSEKKRLVRRVLSHLKEKFKSKPHKSTSDVTERNNFLNDESLEKESQLEPDQLKSSTPINFHTETFPYLDILKDDPPIKSSKNEERYQNMFAKYNEVRKPSDSSHSNTSFNMGDERSIVEGRGSFLFTESPLTPQENESNAKLLGKATYDTNTLDTHYQKEICGKIQGICRKFGIEETTSPSQQIMTIEVNSNMATLLDQILLEASSTLENVSTLKNEVYKASIAKEELTKRLYIVEKELVVKKEGMRTELQNRDTLLEKYKSKKDQINELFELTEPSTKKDVSDTEKLKTLFNILETHSLLKTKIASLYNENTGLKEMCRTLKMEVQNSKDELEDKTYEAIKSQFQKVIFKLEQCIEEYKGRGELLQERYMGTVDMYNEEREKVIGLRKEKKILGSQIQLLDCQKNESLQFMSQFMNSFSNYVDKNVMFEYNILLESLTSKLNIEFLSSFTDFQFTDHFEKIETQLHEFYQEVATNKFMDQLISQFVQTIGTNNILSSQLESLDRKCNDQVEYINELTHYIKKLKRRKKQQRSSHSQHNRNSFEQKIKED
ncbi:similar to Kazachstania africana KAFR_0C01340 hypothetical protein [Maudiozyma saulgeensis]|uniref:Uncharacterized protein n=1 Tax=Maudiozyma saulgeensis TaxID=1789683 RepID=A0A1X7R8E6_9SACH|nr:similar to Kazachstania africana KAFR_0C01340 hypothetical protein [Kazachstania saulgeensis]